MTSFRPLLALACASLACFAGQAFAQEALTLEPGEAKVLTAPAPVARIVIDEAGVVSARVKDRTHVELTGVKPGETGVRLVVRGREPGGTYAVTVKKNGAAAAEALQAKLRADPALADVNVTPAAKGFQLSGEVKDVEAHAQANAVAAAETDAPLVDAITVTGPQMVAVDVRFYAVSARTLNELGFNFSYLDGDFQGGLLAPSTLQSFNLADGALDLRAAAPLQDAFNLLLAKPGNGALGVMSVLSNAGLSQMLAHPTLLVRSGETADFLAGGDVPIPVPQTGANGGAITIEYRPYGVRLAVSAMVLSERKILLKLSPEVSELDYANQVQVQGVGVPAFRRRSTSTTVELGDGQSFVIAGLTYMSGSDVESKVPGLGDLPILGSLFKTSQTSHERQELIVVATPRLVNPMDHDPLEGVEPDFDKRSFGARLLNGKRKDDPLTRLGLSR